MSRIKRAKKIRDDVLRHAGLSLEASLALGGEVRTVSNGAWEAHLSRVREGYASMPVAGAGRLDLWVDGEKVAVIAWTTDRLWTPLMKRGSWETVCFNQPRYRNSAERWMDVCSRPPIDHTVLVLMRQSQPVREAGRPTEALVAM
jgi:hypothetical protein